MISYLTRTLRYIAGHSTNLVNRIANFVAQWTRRGPANVNIYGGTFNVVHGTLAMHDHQTPNDDPSSHRDGLELGWDEQQQRSKNYGPDRNLYTSLEAGVALEAVGMLMSAA